MGAILNAVARDSSVHFKGVRDVMHVEVGVGLHGNTLYITPGSIHHFTVYIKLAAHSPVVRTGPTENIFLRGVARFCGSGITEVGIVVRKLRFVFVGAQVIPFQAIETIVCAVVMAANLTHNR